MICSFAPRFWFTVLRRVEFPLTAGIAALTMILLQPLTAVSQPAISPGFSPNPLVLRGTGGGKTPMAEIVDRTDTAIGPCTGYANTQPDQTLVILSFFNALSLQIESADDTALAVKGPGGVWCNDDDNGKNPGISGQWLPGTYSIWVSSYNQNRLPSYILRIQENR